MNPGMLHNAISLSLNAAIRSGQTRPVDAVAVLELIKFDLMTNIRRAAEEESERKIIPAAVLPAK